MPKWVLPPSFYILPLLTHSHLLKIYGVWDERGKFEVEGSSMWEGNEKEDIGNLASWLHGIFCPAPSREWEDTTGMCVEGSTLPGKIEI